MVLAIDTPEAEERADTEEAVETPELREKSHLSGVLPETENGLLPLELRLRPLELNFRSSGSGGIVGGGFTKRIPQTGDI